MGGLGTIDHRLDLQRHFQKEEKERKEKTLFLSLSV